MGASEIAADPTSAVMARRANVASMSKKSAAKAAAINALVESNTRKTLVDLAASESVSVAAKDNKLTIATRIVEYREQKADRPTRAEILESIATPAESESAADATTEPARSPLEALFVGGPIAGSTWTKTRRGPWPQAASAETAEPITPDKAMRALAETASGIYVHMVAPDGMHLFAHSSTVTALRALWDAA